MDLVSVIIPVYNVENYLSQCIESVINQTYENIEIIIIDDGSTDSCPQICDRFSLIDSRITVVHQKNHGQGHARNVGIKIAKGQWITFLDSDDYLEKRYVEVLVSKAISENADIAICNYRHVDEQDRCIKGGRRGVKDEKKYTGAEAMEVALYWKEFGVSPWAKLYAKKMWDNIRFKEDRIYEDLATTYLVYHKAECICFINECLLNYRVRKNSDVHQPFNSRKIRTLDSSDEILSYCMQNSLRSVPAAKARCLSSACFIYFRIPESELALYENEIKRCQSIIKSFRMGVLFDKHARLKTRMGALLSFGGFKLERKIFKILIER